MHCIDVHWVHDSPDAPVRLVSELDAHRFEVRKLEFHRDGRVGWAWRGGRSASTRPGEADVPALAEINQDPQFRGVEMDCATFDQLWRQYGPDRRFS